MYQHVYFLNFHILVFAEIINIDGNVGWVFALQKIEELKKIVREQDERISIIEKRPAGSEIQSETELQNKKKQDEHIYQLEATILELETIVEAEDNSPLVTPGNGALSETNGIMVP